MEGNKGLVCVTGGTGFVASWLIKRLLEHGYSVNTTIRPDPERKRDLSFLTSLPGATEKLKIFQADLDEPEDFNEPIKGCVGVFHVATPVDFENKEPEEVIVKRAIEGTLGILKVCLNARTVKRVVYTSSASAVEYDVNSNGDLLDERFWSDVDHLRSQNNYFVPYMVSKTLTERKAIEFAAQHGLDLVTLIPTFIVGPFICPKLPGSVRSALALILSDPKEYFHLLNISMVHTDDVARAHIFLFEDPKAEGRYNCSTITIKLEELAKFLSAKYPEYPIPSMESLKDVKGHKPPGLSSKKLVDAGFTFNYGIEETFDDAIKCCKKQGYL